MNTYSQRFRYKIYSIKQQIPVYTVYKEDNWLKIHQKSKYVYDVMSSKCASFRQDKLKIFTHSESWQHKLVSKCCSFFFHIMSDKLTHGHGIDPKGDNLNKRAKSFQMRYNLSQLNDQNYQNLIYHNRFIFSSFDSIYRVFINSPRDYLRLILSLDGGLLKTIRDICKESFWLLNLWKSTTCHWWLWSFHVHHRLSCAQVNVRDQMEFSNMSIHLAGTNT